MQLPAVRRPRHTTSLLVTLLLSSAIVGGLLGCSDRVDGSTSKVPSEEHAEIDVGADIVEHTAEAKVAFDEAEPASPGRTKVNASRRRGVISNDPPLSTTAFLTADDIQPFFHDDAVETAPIAGQSPSPTYNSIRFAPSEHPHQFGIGLQIWQLEEISAPERLTELRAQYLNVRKPDHKDAPRTSFISERAGIRTFVFASKDDSHLFALSCGSEHCPDWTPLYELGLKLAGQ